MTAGGPPLPPPQAPGPWEAGQHYQPPPPPSYPVYQGHPAAAPYQNLYPGPAPGIGYAGFWIRVLAATIDSIIFLVPFLIFFFVAEGAAISSYGTCVNTAAETGTLATQCFNQLFSSFGLWELVAFGIQFLYFVVLWSQFGGTLGQRLLGLHVVDAATGQNIGIGRAIGRYVGYLISSFALYIGLIWVAFDPRKQGWHDKIASTFVVRKV
jgi:uncharacterized RDD family membrane protein YckC